VAALSGAKSTTVSDADAGGFFLLRIVDDGTLEFWVGAEPAWAGGITALHIHRGDAGADGPSVADLLSGGAVFDPVTGIAIGTIEIDPALAEELAADPAAFYVNISTGAAPAGFVRAQLTDPSDANLEWHAKLRGDEEAVVVDADARGAATFSVAANGTLEYVIAMESPSVDDVTGVHIHAGPAGVTGGILVDLNLADATIDSAAGTIRGTIQVGSDVLARVLTAPEFFYLNVHTAAAPDGVARGQVVVGAIEFWAQLSGAEETTVVDPDATGGVTLEFPSFTEGLAILAVPPAQDIFAVNAAHVHEGAAGVDGGVVINLLAGADFNRSGPTGSADGTIEVDQIQLTRMMASPSGFYVNFHTAPAPGGLVRGQLTDDAQTFFTQLRGDAETTVVDPDAEGVATMVLTGAHECSFTITMTQPDAADIENAHLHDGPAATDGPVLIDLLNGSDVETNGDTITGRAVVSGRTFARLLADAELFYFNVHTAAAPAGIARGQARLLSGDLPPAGLTYTTPVTYSTGVKIANNTPSSTGGAIIDYSVSPSLPAGMFLNPTTGVIAGTPSVAAAQANYTVTASNNGGTTTAIISITVNLSPPASLSYGGAKTYVTGTQITPVTPSRSGGQITNYAVSPALPTGLSINAGTGVLSGTPTVAATQATYVVTGSNSAGSVIANLVITVTAALQPPSNLSYTSPVSYSTGTAITANSPTISGGAVATWSISPTLPAGLAFSTANGNITGTPTTVTAQNNYTVTASNAAGSTTATVTITVALGAPTNLSYSPNSTVGYVTGGTFTSMNPTSNGGAVSTYSISPTLPAGVSINASTGVISGTPTATSAQTTYTVTASNSTGNTTATVLISVLP
jgi:hypothetical protein